LQLVRGQQWRCGAKSIATRACNSDEQYLTSELRLDFARATRTSEASLSPLLARPRTSVAVAPTLMMIRRDDSIRGDNAPNNMSNISAESRRNAVATPAPSLQSRRLYRLSCFCLIYYRFMVTKNNRKTSFIKLQHSGRAGP
jgi:hypothetical protein